MSALRQALLIAGAVLLIVSAGLFLYLFERADVEVETGPAGEARYNPYLAAALTLDELGMPTRRSRVMEVPAETDGALLLLAPARMLELRERERLLGWVSDGGRLVVLATEEDLLLNELGFRTAWWAEAGADTAADDTAVDTAAYDAFAVTLSGETPGGAPVTVAWSGARSLSLDLPPDWQLGALAARSAYGLGTVTVLSEAHFLSNEALGDYDHATLLWSLLDGDGEAPPAAATLVYWTQPASLWRWLKAVARPALVSGFVLLVVWLWGASRRFGPTLPDPAPSRRSLLEHLDAAGNYAWKRGDRRALLMGVRDAVAARPGVSEEAIDERLPEGEGWQDTRSFTRAVAALMTIWRDR